MYFIHVIMYVIIYVHILGILCMLCYEEATIILKMKKLRPKVS